MNLILSGFHEKIYFQLVRKISALFDVRYLIHTYTTSKLSLASKVKVERHSVVDLANANYNVNWQEITPLDENLIVKMASCETVVLRMMDRLTLSINQPLSYNARKRLYLRHLRYWNHMLETKSIDLFLSSSPPHEVYDFVLYCLCKLKKIPTLFLFQTNIPDTVIMMQDWELNIFDIQKKYKQLLSKYRDSDESKIHLTNRFERDFKKNTEIVKPVRFEMLRRRPTVGIIKNLSPFLSKLGTRRIIELIIKPDLFVSGLINHFNYLIHLSEGKKTSRFYEVNSNDPDLTQKYIYFPLHMQPELTTSPMAGVFVDQLLIAQTISHFLPKDVFIYVKENPFQEMARRDVKFYKDLLEIPQVRLIRSSYDTFSLTANCLAVATATGTVGLEALYRCKPVLMFGHNFYQYANGVFMVEDIKDCENAIHLISNGNYRLERKSIKIFLKALEDFSIEGYIDVDYKKDTLVNDRISIENLYSALVIKIKQICKL